MAKVPAFARAFAGRRRIVGADLWDRSYLDLNGPATVTIGAGNHGEIGFGAMQATLDLGYGPSMVFFTWTGSDEMDEVNGDGHAELLDDGTIEITFAYHNGDEAVLKAERDASSTACSARSFVARRKGCLSCRQLENVSARHQSAIAQLSRPTRLQKNIAKWLKTRLTLSRLGDSDCRSV